MDRLFGRSLKIGTALVVALLATALMAGSALAQQGNRGTVKIHVGAGEPAPEVRNQPKVCTFHLHGFFFHPGQQLTFSIVGHGGPNAGPDTYLAENVTTDGDGEVRVPSTGSIQLADGMYKLTVDTGRGQPATQNKHKVFKVECPVAPDPDPDKDKDPDDRDIDRDKDPEVPAKDRDDKPDDRVRDKEKRDPKMPDTATATDQPIGMVAGGLAMALVVVGAIGAAAMMRRRIAER